MCAKETLSRTFARLSGIHTLELAGLEQLLSFTLSNALILSLFSLLPSPQPAIRPLMSAMGSDMADTFRRLPRRLAAAG